jgi:hypothetical protein
MNITKFNHRCMLALEAFLQGEYEKLPDRLEIGREFLEECGVQDITSFWWGCATPVQVVDGNTVRAY